MCAVYLMMVAVVVMMVATGVPLQRQEHLPHRTLEFLDLPARPMLAEHADQIDDIVNRRQQLRPETRRGLGASRRRPDEHCHAGQQAQRAQRTSWTHGRSSFEMNWNRFLSLSNARRRVPCACGARCGTAKRRLSPRKHA